MKKISWETIKADFDWDGSWRDIYVFETTLHDWDNLIVALPNWGYSTNYTSFGKRAPNIVPSDIFDDPNRLGSCMTIDIGGISVNCHFFQVSEIEFDIDPLEVDGEPKLKILIEFIRRVGSLLKKDVILSPDNWPQSPILKYNQICEEVEYIPPQYC